MKMAIKMSYVNNEGRQSLNCY